MLRTIALTLLTALTVAACKEGPTDPDDDYEPPIEDRRSYSVYDPGFEIDLPPLQVKATFWTCAGQAEGIFVDAVAQILVLEARALSETDPVRQSILLAQVAQLKHQAKMALYFALEQCVAQYGAPRWFATTGADGSLRLVTFTVGAYHAYLVEKHLEKD